MPTIKPIVIMGAGPAGLTAAWELVRSGREVIVWEADPSYVGGLARTVQADGYRFDIGGHLFRSKSAEVNEFWRKAMPDDFVACSSPARIYFRGKLLDYPLRVRKVAFSLGLGEGIKSCASYLRARLKPIKPEENLAQWVINRYGRRLYELLFKAYFEKLLGLPCEQISASLAERHFQTLTDGRVDFYYPRHGPGQMWESVANRVLERNNGVFLDRKVQTVHWDETGVTHITGTNAAGEFFQLEGSHFLSSLPLGELLLSLDPPPPKEVAEAARSLRHRALVTACLIVNRETVFAERTLAIHDPVMKVANIQNYKNWSADMVADPATTSLGLEYFCSEGDNTWNATDYDLAQLAIREAVQLGFIREPEIKDAFVVRMPKAYPIYNQKYQHHLEVIKQWVGLFANLQPLGRNGLHSFNHQDHSMMTAMLAVRNIQGGSFDCWKVDADAQYPNGPQG
jgi:protoporphyrinogen oxidase